MMAQLKLRVSDSIEEEVELRRDCRTFLGRERQAEADT